MADLIACLSTGKGTWSSVVSLIKAEEWERVFLITNEFGKEKFQHEKAELIVVNGNVKNMSEQIYNALKGKVAFNDIALNFISGSGAEHMAIISAVLKLGVGIRFVIEEEGKIKEI